MITVIKSNFKNVMLLDKEIRANRKQEQWSQIKP